RRDTVSSQQVVQIGSAREDRRVALVIRQQRDRFLFGARAGVFKGIHARPPFNASRTRLGVSGRTGTRTPGALATALEMAAPGAGTGGSPRPTTPRSYSLSGWCMIATSSPMSPMRGSL